MALVAFMGTCLGSYHPSDPPAQTVYPRETDVANLCGPTGAVVAHHLRMAVGYGAYFVLFALVVADVRLFSRREPTERFVRIFGRILGIWAVCAGLQILMPPVENGPLVGNGGYLGAWTVALLDKYISSVGTLILVGCVFIAGILLTGEIRIFRFLLLPVLLPVRVLNRIAFGRRSKANGNAPESWEGTEDDWSEDGESDDDASEDENDEEESDEEPETPAVRRPIKVNPPITADSMRDAVMHRLEAGSRPFGEDYELPGLGLLAEAEEFPYELLAQKAQGAAQTLERTFHEFGLKVQVSEIDTGPVVTQFELELEKGLRLSKVTALADDLAVALRVPAVRVVAPIPGKNTVGVEVPNEKQVMVRLRELIETSAEDIEKMRIPIFLGKDVRGRPLTVDLTKMPHLLIAGRTGTGKSVCLNALIISILMTRSPDEVKMLLIDPKMVELSPYKRIPHLMHPVITDMKKAEAVLAWAVDKMEERYDLLARCGVRHLDSYNKLGKEKVLERLGIDPDDEEESERIPEKMPYIVIVADEMADMMMTSGKDVEGHIIRLAQKSRAVGIHLVLATQKPTVDVITGLIKSNLPARISFQVASRVDSRVVLDEMGADKLLGNGDMLYLAPGTSNITRAQGAFVSAEEVDNIIEFFSGLEPQYSPEIAQITTASTGGNGGIEALRKRDELYEQAIDVVIREGRGSVSLLQRALGIGYGRGARLIDYMAEDGIVGDYNGSQAREVLYSPDQWAAVQAGEELEEAEA